MVGLIQNDEDIQEEEDLEEYHGRVSFGGLDDRHRHHHQEDNPALNAAKANHIASSAGTQRLNRIMRNTAIPDAAAAGRNFLGTTAGWSNARQSLSHPSESGCAWLVVATTSSCGSRMSDLRLSPQATLQS